MWHLQFFLKMQTKCIKEYWQAYSEDSWCLEEVGFWFLYDKNGKKQRCTTPPSRFSYMVTSALKSELFFSFLSCLLTETLIDIVVYVVIQLPSQCNAQCDAVIVIITSSTIKHHRALKDYGCQQQLSFNGIHYTAH